MPYFPTQKGSPRKELCVFDRATEVFKDEDGKIREVSFPDHPWFRSKCYRFGSVARKETAVDERIDLLDHLRLTPDPMSPIEVTRSGRKVILETAYIVGSEDSRVVSFKVATSEREPMTRTRTAKYPPWPSCPRENERDEIIWNEDDPEKSPYVLYRADTCEITETESAYEEGGFARFNFTKKNVVPNWQEVERIDISSILAVGERYDLPGALIFELWLKGSRRVEIRGPLVDIPDKIRQYFIGEKKKEERAFSKRLLVVSGKEFSDYDQKYCTPIKITYGETVGYGWFIDQDLGEFETAKEAWEFVAEDPPDILLDEPEVPEELRQGLQEGKVPDYYDHQDGGWRMEGNHLVW